MNELRMHILFHFESHINCNNSLENNVNHIINVLKDGVSDLEAFKEDHHYDVFSKHEMLWTIFRGKYDFIIERLKNATFHMTGSKRDSLVRQKSLYSDIMDLMDRANSDDAGALKLLELIQDVLDGKLKE